MTDVALPVLSPQKLTEPIWLERGWSPVVVAFCPSEQAWKYLQRRYDLEANWHERAEAAASTARYIDLSTNRTLIVLALYKASESDAQEVILSLVHEAGHVWQFTCQTIGERNQALKWKPTPLSISAVSLALLCVLNLA